MPVYEYECSTCGPLQEFRPMDKREAAAVCPICDGEAPRIISAPNLSLMPPIHRMAAVRNERSQHEPRVGTKGSCCAGRPCTHQRRERKTKDGKPALRGSTKKNRRPWMLGH